MCYSVILLILEYFMFSHCCYSCSDTVLLVLCLTNVPIVASALLCSTFLSLCLRSHSGISRAQSLLLQALGSTPVA